MGKSQWLCWFLGKKRFDSMSLYRVSSAWNAFFEQACFEYPTKLYREWLNTDNTDNKIFENSYLNKIPKPLKYCEELFDATVLVIKKLVIDIGNLTPIVHKERKKKFIWW